MQIDDGTNQTQSQGGNLNTQDGADYSYLAPKDNEDFKNLFGQWVTDFHDQYLSCELGRGKQQDKEAKLQTLLFHVQARNFDNAINPDISGNLIKSIFDSTQILKNSTNNTIA